MLSGFGLIIAMFGACLLGEMINRVSDRNTGFDGDLYWMDEPRKKTEKTEAKTEAKTEVEDEFLKEDTKIKRVEVEL